MQRSGVRSSSSPPPFLQAVDLQRLFLLRRRLCGSDPTSVVDATPALAAQPAYLQMFRCADVQMCRCAVARLAARHLCVRDLVPSDIRAQHPHLPKEIRRSTGTSATHLARKLVRDFPGQFVRGLAAAGLDMPHSGRRASRQHPLGADAQAVLAAGGPQQSRGNAVKRLRHVVPLVECLDKHVKLNRDVLGRLQSSLNRIVAERVDQAAQALDFDQAPDGEDESG